MTIILYLRLSNVDKVTKDKNVINEFKYFTKKQIKKKRYIS